MNTSQLLNTPRISKILLIFGFIILSYILYVICITPTATGYELTLYNAFPKHFFFLIMSIYLLGYLVIFRSMWYKTEKLGYVSLALVLVLIVNVILVSLGYLHGYWLYGRGRCDVLFHIGEIKDILYNGHIYAGNFYPATHLLSAVIISVTNVSYEISTIIVICTFWLSFPLFFYFLSSSMSMETWERLMITVFSTILVFSSLSLHFLPFLFSICMLPLILGTYQHKIWGNKRKVEYSILSLTLAFFIIFAHPVTTIFLLLALFGYLSVSYFLNKSSIYKSQKSNLILVIITTFLTWFLSFFSIQYYIKKVFITFFQQFVPSPASSSSPASSPAAYYGNLYSTTPLSISTTINYLFWNYGHLIILFSISCIYILFNAYKYLKEDKLTLNDAIYSLFQIFAFLISMLCLFGYFVEFEILRIVRLPVFFSILCSGLLFINLCKIKKSYLILSFTVVMFLCSFFVFNIYSSPYQHSTNYQMTEMEFCGLKSIINYRNEDLPLVSSTDILLPSYYLLGNTETSKHRLNHISKIPSNFGYDKHNTLSDTVKYELGYNGSFYSIWGRNMEINYMVLPPEVWEIATKYDKSMTENDISINIIYSNGEHENWLIKN